VLVLCGAVTRRPFRAICEVLVGSLRDARLVVVPDASHNAPVTHAQYVDAEIVAFLRPERPASRA
jgi:pimeloyl-ACP methyl ester carboxylesterase